MLSIFDEQTVRETARQAGISKELLDFKLRRINNLAKGKRNTSFLLFGRHSSTMSETIGSDPNSLRPNLIRPVDNSTAFGGSFLNENIELFALCYAPPLNLREVELQTNSMYFDAAIFLFEAASEFNADDAALLSAMTSQVARLQIIILIESGHIEQDTIRRVAGTIEHEACLRGFLKERLEPVKITHRKTLIPILSAVVNQRHFRSESDSKGDLQAMMACRILNLLMDIQKKHPSPDAVPSCNASSEQRQRLLEEVTAHLDAAVNQLYPYISTDGAVTSAELRKRIIHIIKNWFTSQSLEATTFAAAELNVPGIHNRFLKEVIECSRELSISTRSQKYLSVGGILLPPFLIFIARTLRYLLGIKLFEAGRGSLPLIEIDGTAVFKQRLLSRFNSLMLENGSTVKERLSTIIRKKSGNCSAILPFEESYMSFQESATKIGEIRAVYKQIQSILQERSVFRPLSQRVAWRITKLKDNHFSVMVIGVFNRGKSTLINALLGANLLPSGIRPTTAILTAVRYGREPRVELSSDGRIEVITLDEFQKQFQLGLIDTIRINEAGSDDQQLDRFNSIDMAMVYCPAGLCSNGVEIIDTPGLAESLYRSERVIMNLQRVDAVILVVHARDSFTDNERELVQQELRVYGLQSRLFVAATHWDTIANSLIDASDKNALEQATSDQWNRLNRIVEPVFTSLDIDVKKRVFKVDALEALRLRSQVVGIGSIEATGVPAFERALQTFLIEERDKARDKTDSVLIAYLRSVVNQTIDSELAQMQLGQEAFVARLAVVSDKLNKLRALNISIKNMLHTEADKFARSVGESFSEFVDREIIPNLKGVAEQISLGPLESWSKMAKAQAFEVVLLHKPRLKADAEEHIRGELKKYFIKKLFEWKDLHLRSNIEVESAKIAEGLKDFLERFIAIEKELSKREHSGMPLTDDEMAKRIEEIIRAAYLDPELFASGRVFDVTATIMGVVVDVLVIKLTNFLVPVVGVSIALAVGFFRRNEFRQNVRESIFKALSENCTPFKLNTRQKIEDDVRKVVRDAAQDLVDQLSDQIAISSNSQECIADARAKEAQEGHKFKIEVENFRARLLEKISELSHIVGDSIGGLPQTFARQEQYQRPGLRHHGQVRAVFTSLQIRLDLNRRAITSVARLRPRKVVHQCVYRPGIRRDMVRMQQVIAVRVTAIVDWFDVNKGYGFARIDALQEAAFLPASTLKKFGVKGVYNGDTLTCDVARGAKGIVISKVYPSTAR
jgi:cold shock CspA family protein/predicted GTPase